MSHLQKYSEEFGSLTEIDKQFKTKLYESFLNQEVEALGQYFTPRKVVRSVIRLAGLEQLSFQFSGMRICDPFCGVGGFPLEILNLNERMRDAYRPNNEGQVKPPFVLHGFDKGFERDDERTIILAKANMLIYLAEILFANPSRTEEFSRVFNATFRLFKDNLGTFGHIVRNEDDKYDLILTNPPYVTSGSSIIKEEIRKTPRTQNQYPVNAFGLEGLSIEWIIKSLKKGGRAFIVIPDGVLARIADKKLRDYILSECYLDAIVSLPNRTFFANFENTYLLAITKKNDHKDIQTDPVFTYLVSEIGEKLTSVKREEIGSNDLPELETLFKLFSGAKSESKKILEQQSARCRIQEADKFRRASHWIIDRWWSRNEKVVIGIETAYEKIDLEQVTAATQQFTNALSDYHEYVKSHQVELDSDNAKVLTLGDRELFNLFIGKRITKRELPTIKGEIPVYSANVIEPFGYINRTNIKSFEYPVILWGIDGNFDLNLIERENVFATTDHCGAVQILSDEINPEYLLYAMTVRRIEESFDRSFRASLTNIRHFKIEIPVNNDGSYDIERQKLIAAYFIQSQEKKVFLKEAKLKLDAISENYLQGQALHV